MSLRQTFKRLGNYLDTAGYDELLHCLVLTIGSRGDLTERLGFRDETLERSSRVSNEPEFDTLLLRYQVAKVRFSALL